MKKLCLFISWLLSVTPLYASEIRIDIKDALKIFRENSRIVRIYRDEEEAKRHIIEKVKSSRLPSLELDISYNLLNEEPRSKTPFGNLPVGESNFLKGQLVFSHLLYDFGVRDGLIEKAAIDKELTSLMLKKELNDGSLNVAALFEQLSLLKKKALVYKEELDFLTEQKKRIEGFYTEGLVTKNDLLQIDVEISNTKQKILSNENETENLKERLKTVLNVGDDIEIKESEIDYEKVLQDGFVYEKRPEIEIAKRLIALKELDIKTIEQSRYPKFYGALGLNYEENRYRTSDNHLFASVGMKFNIFDGGEKNAEKLAVLKTKQQYEERLRQTKDIIRLDAVQALNDLKTAKNKIDVAKRVINHAEENLAIEKGRYEEQLITLTDLIAANLRRSRAVLSHHEAETGFNMACYRLLWAKGELYKYGEVLKNE